MPPVLPPLRPPVRPLRRYAATLLATSLLTALLAVLPLAPAPAAEGRNRVTPGSFTGYGFDQCLAPEQWEMDRWLNYSPFLAVGIYIAGDSRGCREQPNLTPSWVATQLRKGWRLLPITLGPQASCSTRFPRYGDDETINPRPGTSGSYPFARRQGWAQARDTVAAARRLGIARRSLLWYDLEAFDVSQTSCRRSALRFLSAWSWQVGRLGYRTGVYSSAASGIAMLDRARRARLGYVLPDYIWIADWDGRPGTHTAYIGDDGWSPHRRVKQYQGGHPETWGRVTINIDRNWVDVGRGRVAPPNPGHCGGLRLSYRDYGVLRPGDALRSRVQVLQCLLKLKGVYRGRVHGVYGVRTRAAAQAWQRRVGAPVRANWTPGNWVTLLADGATPVLKRGSAGFAVRRLQRALNAAADPDLVADGVFGLATDRALRRWQRANRVWPSGVANPVTWAAMRRW